MTDEFDLSSVEISDDEIDRFFESGGDESVFTNKEEEKTLDVVQTNTEVKKEDTDLEKRYKELNDNYQKIMAEINALKAPTKPAEAQPEINYDESPLEYLKSQLDKVTTEFQQTKEQQQYAEQERSLVQKYMAKTEEFTAKTPDFKTAYDFLVNSREQEYITIGYTPEEARQAALQDEYAIVKNTIEKGGDPAELMYSLAKHRGYAVPQKKQESPIKSVVAPVKKVETKAETVKKGQKVAKTLDTIGKTPSDTLSEDEVDLAALAELDGEDFDKAWQKMIKKEMKAAKHR